MNNQDNPLETTEDEAVPFLAAPQQHAQAAQTEINHALDRADAEDAVRFGAQAALSDGELPPLPSLRRFTAIPNEGCGDTWQDDADGELVDADEAISAMREYGRLCLATRQPAPVASALAVAVPDGWKFVPIELNADMQLRGDEATSGFVNWEKDGPSDGHECSAMVERIWSAILNAAPQPVYAPVAAAVAQGDAAMLIVRDVCELDGDYTDEDEVLRVSTHDLRQIVENRLAAQPPADAASELTAKKSDARYAQGYGDGWKEGREAMGAALAQDAAALEIFSSGPWRWSETGQNFTGAELDAEAFTQYKPVIESARQQGRAAGIEEAAKVVSELSSGMFTFAEVAAAIRAINKSEVKL